MSLPGSLLTFCCSGCQLLSAQKTPAQIDGCFIGTEEARLKMPRRTPVITNTKISATARAANVFRFVFLIRSLLDTLVKQDVIKSRIANIERQSSFLDEVGTEVFRLSLPQLIGARSCSCCVFTLLQKNRSIKLKTPSCVFLSHLKTTCHEL